MAGVCGGLCGWSCWAGGWCGDAVWCGVAACVGVAGVVSVGPCAGGWWEHVWLVWRVFGVLLPNRTETPQYWQYIYR